jgi:hypothetical protein
VVGLLIVLVVIYFLSNVGGSSSNTQVTSELLAKRGQCQTAVANLLRLGVRVDRDRGGETTAEYEEAIWANLDHEDKVRQALLWYCADMPDSGSFNVFIRGRKTGKILASVVGGNYFDN